MKEMGQTFTQIDTMTEEGQKELRSKNPIWKVPYFEDGPIKIWDSHSITDYLLDRYSIQGFRTLKKNEAIFESNLIHAIDACLDSGINLFYLTKEGVEMEKTPYLKKQNERIASIIRYVTSELKGSSFYEDQSFGRSELALYTCLDWLRYRSVYPVLNDSQLSSFLQTWGAKENLKETSPP
ncbi:glutathione S-transferase, N-terminal domain protein [Leptospira ryugenii]|uniref:Glutathione S-transferase, N-terminal domain protein n=1 Tax=Leptospira ryugenii TaxID=1917863 RepID=A0A2P2DVV8_9LEPT|nr:glutathione S-transferase, N-terminal domain protein [Leptospira ryugenii]